MYQYFGRFDAYRFMNDLAIVMVFVCNLFYFKPKKNFLGRFSIESIAFFSKSKIFNKIFNKSHYALLEIYLVSVFSYYVTGLFNGLFSEIFATGGNYFGNLLFAPLVVAFLCFFLGIDFFKQMDYATPALSFALFLSKLGCFCAGCCGGIPSKFGLFNDATDMVEFPVQLVEAGEALVIFILLTIFRKKVKEGTLYPIYMIAYSTARFFSEFLRHEENVILIFKKYHLFCLVGIAAGVLYMFLTEKYKEKVREIFDNYFNVVLEIFNDILVKTGIRRKNEIVHHKSKKKRKNIPIQNAQTKEKNANIRRWILVWSLGLVGQIGWSIEGTWINTFVYEKIDKTPTLITPLLIFSALASTVSIFIFGIITDKSGNRRSLISSGFVVWGILTACFGLTQFIPQKSFAFVAVSLVIVDMLLSFFGSMSTDVGYSTWLTDIMNDSNRGQIGGAIAVQVVLGTLLGNVIGGALVGSANNYLRMFISVGSMLSFTGMISVFLFDKKDDAKPQKNISLSKQFSSFVDFKNVFQHKELLWVNVAVAVFFVGFNTYFPHLGNFLIDYLGYSAEKMGIIEAVPMVLAMLVTVPVSNFINKNKYIEVTLLSIISAVIGNVLIFKTTPDMIDATRAFDLQLSSGIFLVAIGYITMLQATKTWTKNLYPENSKGRYEVFWAISYAFVPMLFGSNISEWIIKNWGVNSFNEVTERFEYIPNGKIFLIGAIISAFSIFPIIITQKYADKIAAKSSSMV